MIWEKTATAIIIKKQQINTKNSKKIEAHKEVISFLQRTLEREVRGCQVLIIWTDCDREGENIGFEVIEVCQRSMFLPTCIFLNLTVLV